MSKKKLGLLPKLIIAIALGIAVGMVAPEKLIAIFATFNGIFNQFLGFIIPLIIIGFVVPVLLTLVAELVRHLLLQLLLLTFQQSSQEALHTLLIQQHSLHSLK